jgi:lipopolysaccharide biosynthesis protein
LEVFFLTPTILFTEKSIFEISINLPSTMDANNNSGSKTKTAHRNAEPGFSVLHNSLNRQSDKLCLFATYSFTGEIADYVLHYLSEIAGEGYNIVFVSTSILKATCIEKLEAVCQVVIERKNKGLDFASWQCGLGVCNWGIECREILLTNDSVFGPLYKLGPIFNTMNRRFDIWGMTDNYEIDYHLQSYFLHFGEKAIKSEVWMNFWKNINPDLPKKEIIKQYEVGLSQIFTKAGFKMGAYAPIDLVMKSVGTTDKFLNSVIAFWQPLIEKFDFPFFKRELLINPTVNRLYWHKDIYTNTVGWRKVIEHQTNYDINLVDSFLDRYFKNITTTNHNIKVRKKKILFITHNADIGGAQKVLIYFLKWLKKHTDIPFETLIAHPTQKEELFEEFALLGLTTRFYALSEPEKQALKDRLINEYVGLIFSNTSVNVGVQQFLSFLHVPQLTYVHELPYVLSRFEFIKENKAWLKDNISHFIACAHIVKQELKRYYDELPDESVSVVNGFIEESERTSGAELDALRQKLNIPQHAFIVGMSGTFEWRKSADLIPALAGMLCKQHPDIHILWLGVDFSSQLYENIENDLNRSGLQKNVHLIEKQKNPNPYYDLFDLFVLPSREDPFPLVNLENGLRGKPVICFENSGGSPEYVALGTGVAVPYLDLAAMRDAALSYYRNRQELLSQAPDIVRVAKTNFVTDVQAPKLLSVVRNYYDDNDVVPIEFPVITIMTHLFYDNTWKDIKNKLLAFTDLNTRFFFSISEGCLIKDEIVKDIYKSFPGAYVLTTSNIGKDIGGKMAMIDLYLALGLSSEYIILLHDKQSPQTLVGESWKNNLHKIIDIANYDSIVKLFKKDENIAIVGAKEHIHNEYNPETASFAYNNEFVSSFLKKYQIKIDNYDYISGTMYWMKASIIETFFSLHNPMQIRAELEAGNVLDNHGGTKAHTWERMLCWIAANKGYKLHGI